MGQGAAMKIITRTAIAIALLALFAANHLAAQTFDKAALSGMRWRSIGPARGGRALAVAGAPTEPNTYYFGAVAGGIWKTADGGNTWAPIFDGQSIASIGALAVAESDPNVIYAGTGEACIRGDITHGDGIYKSTDAGKTWSNIGLRDTRHVGRIAVHPRNPDVAFVAALGHVFGPNAERGIFRTANGGKTWEKVLYKDEKTGGIDVVFSPGNPNVVFAALWEANRSPWGATSGGPGSGLYRSTDGGSTWKRMEGGALPRSLLGRIGVAVSGADVNRVYALLEAREDEGGLFVSDNGGDSWRKINDDRRFRQRAWYYTHIYADPRAVDTVYILNTGFYRSTDAGRSFTPIGVPHGDNHGLWIDPTNPQRMINANDGGANVSVNGGRTWTRQDTQPTAQFYHVTTDNQVPYHVYGAQQDNSTVAISSRGGPFVSVGGCESGYIAVHPRDHNIVYAGCYGGHITRFDKRTGQAQEVNAWPENPMGQSAGVLKHRWQWTAPIFFSPHDPNVLYHAAEVLFKTTNGGMSWTAISPDLTRNDKSKQGDSGGPITRDNTSVEYYDTIFAAVESPQQNGLLWVGTDDGLLHLSRDGGKNWTNITPKDMAEWSLISQIDPSPHDPGTIYVAVDRHELDDYKAYIYKTADFGKTWTRLGNGIPEGAFVRVVREDPRRKGLLYAGTELGVFVSFNDGAQWQPLQLNLPVTPIHDLVVKDDDLVVATHGRSFWILDDVTPLQQLTDAVAAADAHLYRPRPAWRGLGGASIPYFLKSDAREEVAIEILDAQGKVLRRFSSRSDAGAPAGPTEFPGFAGGLPRPPTAAGMQRFNWDLRTEPARRVPGAISWGGSGAGPRVLPGTYTVRLSVGSKQMTAPLEVKLDPRLNVSPGDLQKQFDLLVRLRESVNQAHDTVNHIRELRGQLQAIRRRLAAEAKARPILDAADALDKKMSPVEEAILQVKSKSSQDPLNYPIMLNDRLMALMGTVESADTAPTAQALAVYDSLRQRLEAQLARWNEVTGRDLPALNDLIRKEGVALLALTPVKRE
jgi:photosystem II stability/assembly factor-like uncharacterized protein